jgi:hypothetical protein
LERVTKLVEVAGHRNFTAALAKVYDILGNDVGIDSLCRWASQQTRVLGREESEEASIPVTQLSPRLISKMGPWPTVVERIAGLECRIPTIAVFFGANPQDQIVSDWDDALEWLLSTSIMFAAIAVAAIFGLRALVR